MDGSVARMNGMVFFLYFFSIVASRMVVLLKVLWLVLFVNMERNVYMVRRHIEKKGELG